MKKFFVGLLSVFLLFGASILSACDSDKTTLSLSKETVEIQIYAGEEESYQTVTAEVKGTDKASISATAHSSYESIVKVTTSKISDTKVSIKIEGLNEGDAVITVKSGKSTQYIRATVFSEVSEMTQKTEDGNRKNNFLVRGQENLLKENNLIKFTPSEKSRRTITWSLTENLSGVILNENVLTIDNSFIGDNISLKATTEKGVETIITLPVLDKIDQVPEMQFSYSELSDFDLINEENNTFNIVPNVPSDEHYQGYVLINYKGDLEITGYALDSNGNTTDDIEVNRNGSIGEFPLFVIYANKEKTNINQDYKIGFRIGYSQYNYACDTFDTMPINIQARERVNGIIISTRDSGNIANSIQTLYTEYADSNYSTVYGQEFKIMTIPTTVVGATNKYSITLARTEAGAEIADGCPVEIWYRDVVNGGVWTFVPLILDAGTGNYVTKADSLPNASTIYIKGSNTLKQQIVTGLTLTFTSADNPIVSSSFDLKLVRSVAEIGFKSPEGDFIIDSSLENVILKKQYTLVGQSTIEGLYIISDSKAVTFDEIHYLSSDTESVTFEVAVTLNKSSYGITRVDYYRVAHRNGIMSEEMKLDIFLPLKEAGIYVDTANNQSNSIIDTNFDTKTYDKAGALVPDADNESLSELMLKNSTTTPLVYSFNEINGISAVANIGVEFFDFNEGEDDLLRFISLADSNEGVLEILNKSKGNPLSSIAYFTSDYSSIITKGVGYTYAVISFTGKGTEGVDAEGKVTLIKILRIESLVTPEGMQVYPDSNKNVELYSIESLATSDEYLTKQDIKINFTKSDITYTSITNLNFISRSELMGKMSFSGDGSTVSWKDGRYTISNIKLSDECITFTIAGLHTFGEYIFTDTLDVHYSIYNFEGEKVYDISSAIKITIKNAQRIESITWDNYDNDGLYFEIGDDKPQYMLFKTSPTNVKNKNLAYVLTDKEGIAGKSFISISDTVSSDTLAVNLSKSLTEGMTGYLYILPADAIYNNQIKYYYLEDGEEKSGYIAPSALGAVVNNEGLTNYEYLITNAYFKSNVTAEETKNVDFKDIILKIQVVVADGKNFEHSYRIYDEDGFKAMMDNKYYTVMTSLDITDRTAFANFSGGLQGYNKDVTVRFNNTNFADIIMPSAEIRNIKFSGSVVAKGFVANTNYGAITNVTIDVDGICASELTVPFDVVNYGGGIVGMNYGTINGAKVLGLNISGENNPDGTNNKIIGGIAGQNKGKIENSAVEFYNLKTSSGFGVNKFVGNVVGAIVGEILGGSSISYTYAYDYTLTDGYYVIETVGADAKRDSFAGHAVLAAGETATINYSFTVVNQIALYNNGTYSSEVKLTNYYNSYYFTGNYTVDFVSGYESNPNFVQSTADNFDAEVNGGKAYLKELQQPEKVTNVNYSIKTSQTNGYYKSVEVDSENGILFYYALQSAFVELNVAEQNDLNALNTISLAKLLGEDNVSENIIVTSSDINIIKVVGSSIIIRKTGEVELTLSSKQNVELNKTIKVKVISPISQMQISWTDMAENVNYIADNSQLSIQKTRTRDFTVSFYRTQVYLGGLATAYNIVENDYSLDISTDIAENAIEYQVTNRNEFKLLSKEDSLLTTFNIAPKLFEEEKYQTAINSEFTRTFKVLPTEGLISFAISGDTITISPSINASVKAEIKTTADTDSVYPVVTYEDEILLISRNLNVFYFTLPGEDKAILEAVVTAIETPVTEGGVTTYLFDINFAVAEDYKTNIAHEYEFEVILKSESGNSSEEWGGKFTIHVSQQEFTNIDVSNRKITSPHYQYDTETSSYVEVYTTDVATAVLAPGNSSILQVNVNPDFAYYDYVELSYSGAKVSNAVNAVVVEPFRSSTSDFKKKAIENNNIETINSKLVFRPQANEKSTLYYKLWINTTVNRDTTLCLTATFYLDGAKVIDYVNYYITVSYLTEPTITVDGASTTYLAKGSSAEIKIDVLMDQKVDNLILEGDNVQGINVSQLSSPVVDFERGIKTYTAKVYATVEASTDDNNTFYLRARVSRELNGAKEIKDSIATVAIVDFKIDTNSISIENAKDGNLIIWQGVSKPVLVNYDILPENYPYPSTPEMATAIEKLREARDSFKANDYYPASVESDTKYLINYTYDNDKGYIKQTLLDRLFVVVNNVYYPLNDTSIEKPFDVVCDEVSGTVSFEGTKISGSVNMVLKTYITSSYVTQTIETPFTVTVEAYSDPDLPIKISNADDFNNLNPEKYSGIIEQNDYILENDILLENYSAFNTDLISSLDGNGHTIFIKSFNLNNTNSKTLNLALFNNVKEFTTLKNLRVNLYNGGQLTINVSTFKTINIAGFAIENSGVVTNCEVVSFYTSDRAVGEVLSDSACTLHNGKQGINVSYVSSNGTDEIYLPDNANWSSQVAGFVIENAGSITNSRVGGEEIIIVGEEKKVNNVSTGYTYASSLTLDTFNIIGQGNIAGFVLTNSGYITSSFVKNIEIENQSNSISFYTAGFAGINNSAILTSYVEGAPSVEADMPEGEYSQFAFEGTSISSKLGYVVGFTYNNIGSIKDSYSNILIANSTDVARVYYASGFVYMNEGTVENSYSASQIANSKFSQMNFSGVNERGDLLKTGEYINCYFFNKAYENNEDPTDYSTESQYSTGAQIVPKPSETEVFYGFAIADGENDGIWRADEQRGIALIEANKTTISHRYTSYVSDEFEGVTAEDSQGRKYILPYSVLTFVDTAREIDTSLGNDFNPILIYDAEDFLEISGTSKSNYVQQYFNDKIIWGSYRLVNNINLLDEANGEETVLLPSSNKAFAGRLYGNGFEITGISISSANQNLSFGLFKSIEKKNQSSPIITNLDLVISQVIAGDAIMVGGLAGYIKDAIIINIDIKFNEASSKVTGLNFVGSLAGLASGDNIIKNINITNPTTSAEKRAESEEEKNYFATANDLHLFRTKIDSLLNYNTSIEIPFVRDEMSKYSYAGSLIGYVDNYAVDNYAFDINQVNNISINNIRVSGRVNVQGQIVGGIIGLASYQTNLRDLGLTIDTTAGLSKILSTKYFAGGIIGQSFGGVSRTFAVHDKTTQDAIEDNMSKFYSGDYDVERGQLDLFSSGTANYTQEYIGGLIGFVGSGKLEVAYSKLNVTASSANYAGGVIGGVEAYNALTYQTDTNRAIEPVYTKYFMHEVYATGDVRANIYNSNAFAGGIIGVIKGEDSAVGLLSVNAFNYLTTYNYTTNSYSTIEDEKVNISSTLKVNSLVGRLIDVDIDVHGNVTETPFNVDSANLGGYLTLIKAGESIASDSSAVSIREVSSIGIYEAYFQQATVNMIGVLDGRISEENVLYNAGLVYAIAKPYNYTDSSVGHTFTQSGFINSGAWRADNWVHRSIELFPEIRYKRTYDIMFLDQYNVKQVFARMNGGNVKVIVRGRVEEDSEVCGDIDLKDLYFDVYGYEATLIQGFSGILEGGGGQMIDPLTGKERDVKIISDRTFIESTGPGFSINKLTIDYVSESGAINIKNGLLTNSAISDAAISKLTLNLNAPVIADLTSVDDGNVGLIAPSITNTTIVGVEIITTSDQAILQVTGKTTEGEEETELNVGLLAGTASQTSTISSMDIENIQFNVNDLISVHDNEVKNIYVGTYFGNVTKSPESQPLSMKLDSIKSKSDDKAVILVSGNTVTDLFLGGYIGSSTGINFFSFDTEKEIKAYVDFSLKDNDIANTYVGGVIATSDTRSINGSDLKGGAEINSTLFVNNTENLYAGGVIAGSPTSTGSISLSNFGNVGFGVASHNSLGNPSVASKNKNSLSGNYDSSNAQYTNVNGKARVGVIAGYWAGEFIFTSSSANLNSSYQSFRLKGNDIIAGSVLGEAGTSAIISGPINSSAEFMINTESDSAKMIIGGILGHSETGNVSISGTAGGVIGFNGAVYSNAKTLTFGGIVGSLNPERTDTDSYVYLNKTSFGGVVKIYGENSDNSEIITGGSIGKIPTMKALIKENYNYGDVFVEYGEYLSSLSEYVFGGLIADSEKLNLIGTIEIASGAEPCAVAGNYSLVTSHNARYSTVTSNTAHALFGNGNPWGETGRGASNYYNHAVCLLTDNLGVDAGYIEGYDNSLYRSGYGDFSKGDYEEGIAVATTIYNEVRSYCSKLAPSSFDSYALQFNGLRYYIYDGEISQLETDEDNVAVIGSITSSVSDYGISKSIVDKLCGFSFVSGISRNFNVSDDVSTGGSYAPLVGTMSGNAIVYAVNITGTYDIGGSAVSNVAGIVADFRGGKIFDSSTDLDLVYRGGTNNSNVSTISGIANVSEECVKLIENTYSAGYIQTLVKANIYAFANGDADTTIRNSYTYTKLDPRDYLKAETETGTIGTFGSALLLENCYFENCYYDKDESGYSLSSELKGIKLTGIESTWSELKTKTYGNVWVSDINFNYGYPTLKYGSLKNSSYVKYESEEKQGSTGFDKYVFTNTYSRVANGVIPAFNEAQYFYYIPNKTILTKIAGECTSHKDIAGYVLRYDINNAGELNIGDFKGKPGSKIKYKIFDGQNKTISGLKSTLFNELYCSKIINLRLTEIDIKNAPALAKKLTAHVVVSNMTLSGNVTYDVTKTTEDKYYGAVAEYIYNSEINTTTNMINFVVTGTTGTVYNRVGGFFGYAGGTAKILYCSNYGPVRLSETEADCDDYIGGLVGLMDDATIDYSYNATSVLGNYAASSSALAETVGTYSTGGLVGYMSAGTISNSYNSGMIKSGNKSNSVASYAGGIVGYAKSGKIEKCYNEGSVEALGKNPEWKIVTEKDASGDISKFSLVVYGKRNVWAYGIGFLSDEVTCSDLVQRLIRYSDQETIKQNGYAFDETEKKLKDWNINDVYYNRGLSSYSYVGYFVRQYIRYYGLFTDEKYYMDHVNRLGIKTKEKIDFSSEQPRITSLDSYGIPNRIIVPVTKTITIFNDYSLKIQRMFSYKEVDKETKKVETSILEYGIADYDSQLYYRNPIDILSNQSTGTTIFDDYNNIKQATRSQETEEIETMTVAGSKYYTVETNNSTSVFKAGIYSYSFENIEFAVPYIANKEYYKLIAVDGAGNEYTNISTRIINIEEKGANNVSIDAEIYRQETLPKDLQLKLEFNYQNEINLDLSALKYYYVDDYSFGIEIDDINPSTPEIEKFNPFPIEGYSLEVEGGKVYNKVVKISTELYNEEETADEPIDDNHYTFMYLAVDETKENGCIYIPHATLHRDGEEDITVNKRYISSGTELEANNIKYLINNLFSGQTLYYRATVKDKTTPYNLYGNVSPYSSGSSSITMGIDVDSAETLEHEIVYGKEVSISAEAIFDRRVKKEIPPAVEGEEPTYEYEYYYKVSFEGLPSEDVLGITNTGSVVWGYDYSRNKVENNSTSLSIGDKWYSVTTDGNTIILDNASLTADDYGESLEIQQFFNKLFCIANDWSGETLTLDDRYADLTNEVYIDGVGYLEREISKYWRLTNEHIDSLDVIKTINDDLEVSLKDDRTGLTKYSLGDITIYKGSLTFKSKELYTSKLKQIELFHPYSSLKGYYKLSLSGADKVDTTTYKTAGTTIDIIHSELLDLNGSNKVIDLAAINNEELVGDLSVNIIHFSTYKEGSIHKEENGIYNLALKDADGEYYVEGIDLTGEAPTTVILSFDSFGLYMNVVNNGADTIYTFNINNGFDNLKIDDVEYYGLSITKNASTTKYTGLQLTGIEDDPISEIEFTSMPNVTFDGENISDAITKLSNKSFSNILKRVKVTDETSGDPVDTKYIYSENFEILDSLAWNDKEEQENEDGTREVVNVNRIEYSTVQVDSYEWIEYISPEYTQVEFESELNLEDYKDNVTVSTGSKYTLSDKKGSVYLKVSDNEIIEIDVTEEDAYDNRKNLSEIEPAESHSIILLDDISLNQAYFGSNSDGVNIIGNGYYISYYNSSFYYKFNNNGVFFKNISFLGENYNGALMDSAWLKEPHETGEYFVDVSFYGSVINKTSGAIIMNASGVKLTNVVSYISANGAYGYSYRYGSINLGDIYLFKTLHDESSSTNYGTIIGVSGIKGKNGLYGNSVEDGEDGENGQGISFVNEGTLKISNQGIVKAGDGGNGGAGGSYENGAGSVDGGLKGGELGVGGKKGTSSGFKTSIEAEDGLSGGDGVTTRGAYFPIECGYKSNLILGLMPSNNKDGEFRDYTWDGREFYKMFAYKDKEGNLIALDKDCYQINDRSEYWGANYVSDKEVFRLNELGLQTILDNCFGTAEFKETVLPTSLIKTINIDGSKYTIPTLT